MPQNYRLTFTIGQGELWNGKPIWKDSLATLRQSAYKRIAIDFGGFTAREGFGGWVDDSGKLIMEPSLSIEVVAGEDKLHLGEPTAVFLRDLFRQSAVLWTTDKLEGAELT